MWIKCIFDYKFPHNVPHSLKMIWWVISKLLEATQVCIVKPFLGFGHDVVHKKWSPAWGWPLPLHQTTMSLLTISWLCKSPFQQNSKSCSSNTHIYTHTATYWPVAELQPEVETMQFFCHFFSLKMTKSRLRREKNHFIYYQLFWKKKKKQLLIRQIAYKKIPF